MADLSQIKVPSKVVPAIGIQDFLLRMHGPPKTGLRTVNGKMELKSRTLTIDVRAPAEFTKGCIPGAINIPLFDDAERAVVGTTYKKKGRYDAIKSGLGYIGPKLTGILTRIEKHGLKPGSSILVYCWRGGMRSGAVSWLLSLCGYKVCKLDGGYRSYRRWCKTVVARESSPAPAQIFVLGGYTGSGKTAILNELSKRGEQFLDLEGFANHRGSAFGWIGQAEQPTNETYENMLALAVRYVTDSKPLWIEHEGQHVGACSIPFGIQQWVLKTPNNGCMFVIEMPKQLRGARLVADYCGDKDSKGEKWKEGLKQCISLKKGGLAKRLGGAKVKAALEMLEEGKYLDVAIMMLDYYDKLYKGWVEQSQSKNIRNITLNEVDEKANTETLLQLERNAASDAVQKTAPIVDAKSPNVSEDSLSANDKYNGAAHYTGKCFCGEVHIEVIGSPRSVSYCHCSICRKLSGSPFSCQALFEPKQVTVSFTGNKSMIVTSTSKHVERYRCGNCFSPVKASVMGGKLTAVPLQLLTSWSLGSHTSETGIDTLRPIHHLYYGDRVMDVYDELPKSSSGARVSSRQFQNKGNHVKANASKKRKVDGPSSAAKKPYMSST